MLYFNYLGPSTYCWYNTWPMALAFVTIQTVWVKDIPVLRALRLQWRIWKLGNSFWHRWNWLQKFSFYSYILTSSQSWYRENPKLHLIKCLFHTYVLGSELLYSSSWYLMGAHQIINLWHFIPKLSCFCTFSYWKLLNLIYFVYAKDYSLDCTVLMCLCVHCGAMIWYYPKKRPEVNRSVVKNE